MEKKKNTHGGPGRSPGRSLKFGEASVLVSVSVPKSKAREIKAVFNKYLKKYEVKKEPKKKAANTAEGVVI